MFRKPPVFPAHHLQTTVLHTLQGPGRRTTAGTRMRSIMCWGRIRWSPRWWRWPERNAFACRRTSLGAILEVSLFTSRGGVRPPVPSRDAGHGPAWATSRRINGLRICGNIPDISSLTPSLNIGTVIPTNATWGRVRLYPHQNSAICDFYSAGQRHRPVVDTARCQAGLQVAAHDVDDLVEGHPQAVVQPRGQGHRPMADRRLGQRVGHHRLDVLPKILRSFYSEAFETVCHGRSA